MNFGWGSSIPRIRPQSNGHQRSMSANSPDMERSLNPALLGRDGLYDAPHTEEANPLKVNLSDHSDASTRSLLPEHLASLALSFARIARRNRLAMLFALCGVVWLLVSLTRRSFQG
jgi:hypothetical protein